MCTVMILVNFAQTNAIVLVVGDWQSNRREACIGTNLHVPFLFLPLLLLLQNDLHTAAAGTLLLAVQP